VDRIVYRRGDLLGVVVRAYGPDIGRILEVGGEVDREGFWERWVARPCLNLLAISTKSVTRRDAATLRVVGRGLGEYTTI
jgi:hypothetical protein